MLMVFPLSSAKHTCALSLLLRNAVLELLASAIQQEKEIKDNQIWKEEVKLSLLSEDMKVYVESSIGSIRHLLELISELSKFGG